MPLWKNPVGTDEVAGVAARPLLQIILVIGLGLPELADRLDLEYGDDREFATVAGYCLAVLKKLPAEGEYFEEQGWRFEVVDLDERRIDKVLVSQLAPKAKAEAEEV